MTADRSPLADLGGFDEIIDVRSPAEFAEDHIPGAINCPVLSNEERAQIGTLYTQVSPFEAKRLGAAMVSANLARHLREKGIRLMLGDGLRQLQQDGGELCAVLASGREIKADMVVLAIGVREFAFPPKEATFVGVFQKDDISPAFMLSIDIAERRITIRQVAAPTEPGKTYQLWIASDRIGPAPQSLGLIEAREVTKTLPFETALLRQATFGISLEDAGGSRTGRPGERAPGRHALRGGLCRSPSAIALRGGTVRVGTLSPRHAAARGGSAGRRRCSPRRAARRRSIPDVSSCAASLARTV